MLARHRKELREIVTRNKGAHPRVFGSVARGDDHPGSDVDLLITIQPDMSAFDMVRLIEQAETILGVHVDVVTEDALRPGDQSILEQAIDL